MKRAIIGAGGFARELKSYMGDKSTPMFVDDKYYISNNKRNILPLSEFDPLEYMVIIAIGDPSDRMNMVSRLPKETEYFKYIHPSAQPLNDDVHIGEGSIVCPGVIFTTNIIVGKHCHFNLLTTIGHDTVIGDFFTSAPGAKISGNCIVGNEVYVGTNASIREKITICNEVTIGLNAGVVKNIHEPGTYVGVPAKKL